MSSLSVAGPATLTTAGQTIQWTATATLSDGTLVVVGFIDKGPHKSTVALTHTKLRDRAASDKAKEYWTDRLDALGSLLAKTSHR